MGVFRQLETMEHEQVVYCYDKGTGLKAIIAIHDTTLGPALGGTRMWNYQSEEEALNDVLRLSRGMTYKAAVTGLNLGGGKAVIIGDPKIKSEALFKTFGRFVNSLAGRYITAEDVNIRVRDMEIVATETPYVTGVASRAGGSGDPSPITALGIYHGIRATVKHKLGHDSLKGLKVAVQGCGAVGSFLCEYLHKDGVKLFVADIDSAKVKNLVTKYGAEAVEITKIHAVAADVFAPCALGGILNSETIPEIKATVIAGGANNQLLDEKTHGDMVKSKGILYAPDYVINAGGLINVAQELKGYDADAAKTACGNIYETLLSIYKEADAQGITTNMASNRIVENRIKAARNTKNLNQTLDAQLWYQG